MDRPSRASKHLPGPERPLLSIRLTRGDLPGNASPNQRAQTLLDLALSDTTPTDLEPLSDDEAEFARFLATLPLSAGRTDNPGLVYQHYELVVNPAGEPWVLGRGAMGITYKARDTNLHCEVALKVVNQRYLSDPAARERFLREARAAAGLRHPNIAGIFHLGCRGDDAFYAMEYIVGETLADHVKRLGPLQPAVALDIAAQVALALAAAHRKGFLHRDIKPANLMLVTSESGLPELPVIKVIDFGLVKDITGSGAVTDASFPGDYFIGTPVYASPEQLAHRPLDARADLYSLGATLLYLLTGEAPHTENRLLDSPRELPPPVEELLLALLQPDAAARPRNATEAARLIARCRAKIERPSGSSPAPVAAEQSKVIKRSATSRRRLIVCAAVLLVAVAFKMALVDKSGTFDAHAVAVLPLVNGTSNDALGEVIAQDLRRALSTGGAPDLVRLAPGSFRQDDQGHPTFPDPSKRPRWLFTGSVRREAELLKVNVRLADTRSGRTVWSEEHRYSREVGSLETIRADLARRIVADLGSSDFPGSERFATGHAVPLKACTELAQAEVYYYKSTRQDNQRAIDCCQRALALAPDDARAHALLARACCLGHQRYGELGNRMALAETNARRAIQLAPGEPEGHNALAFIELVNGQQWKALAEDRRAIEVSPGDWLALRDYGTIWIMLGHPERGLPWLKAASTIEPGNVGCYCYLADAYKDLCDDDNAARCIRQALSIDPDFRNATAVGIHLCILQGQWDKARQLCEETLTVSPGDRLMLLLRAQMDLVAGNYSRAESGFRALLVSNPTGNPMLYGGMRYASALGYLRQQQGDHAEGARLLQRAADMDLSADLDGPQNLYDLAATRTAQGNTAEGLKLLRKACEAGWLDFRWLKLDPRFDALHSSEDFWRVVTGVETKIAGMRRIVEQAETKPVQLADNPTEPAPNER